MSWGIHSFSIAKNVLFRNVQLSAELIFKFKHSYLPPQFPQRESAFGECCTSWPGLKGGSVQSSHGITLNYSIRRNLFIVAYDLLIWEKEEGGKKGFHLFLLSFPSSPNQNFEPLQEIVLFFTQFQYHEEFRQIFSLRSLVTYA